MLIVPIPVADKTFPVIVPGPSDIINVPPTGLPVKVLKSFIHTELLLLVIFTRGNAFAVSVAEVLCTVLPCPSLTIQ